MASDYLTAINVNEPRVNRYQFIGGGVPFVQQAPENQEGGAAQGGYGIANKKAPIAQGYEYNQTIPNLAGLGGESKWSIIG